MHRYIAQVLHKEGVLSLLANHWCGDEIQIKLQGEIGQTQV